MVEVDKEFINLLKQFVSKAGCIYTQVKANKLWRELRPMLTDDEAKRLYLEWHHHVFQGEGREALDWECREILKKRNG